MSMTISSHDLADAVFGQLDEMCIELEGQMLVSQSRCVDHLLDLLNLTTNEAIRTVIGEVLDDIRQLSLVKADEMESHYALLAAVVAVESAFETFAPAA